MSDPLGLESQTLVTMWVLGIKTGTSRGAVYTLNHWTIFPDPGRVYFCLTVSETLALGLLVSLLWTCGDSDRSQQKVLVRRSCSW